MKSLFRLPATLLPSGLMLTSALSLALLAAAPAHAAPPTDAQVDQLMQTMNYERMKREIVQQMNGSAQGMAEAMAGNKLSPAQRQSLQRSMDKIMARADQLLAWENVAPIYHKVYRDTFQANEVQAMIDFYGTPEGRSILEKMPKAMGQTMQEMQPLMKKMFEQIQQDLQKDIRQITDEAPPAPPAPPVTVTVPEPPPVIVNQGQ